jgi:hypothetical protein
MTQKPDFQSMPRQELRGYALSHQDDEQALGKKSGLTQLLHI